MTERILIGIIDRLTSYRAELEAGHIIASDDLRLEARRLSTLAETMDEGLAE